MTEYKNTVDAAWTTEEFEQFKVWLTAELHNQVVTVNFTKKDGTERRMRCTLNATEIPVVKETVAENVEPSKPRKINPDVRAIYDVDLGAWRSFRWDLIKSVNYTPKA